jgi:hypothetical protein
MTDEEQTLLLIRGTIAGMPEDDQIQVKCIATTLRNILEQDPRSALAFALVGAEMAAQS